MIGNRTSFAAEMAPPSEFPKASTAPAIDSPATRAGEAGLDSPGY
jgi:hypothetical protein